MTELKIESRRAFFTRVKRSNTPTTSVLSFMITKSNTPIGDPAESPISNCWTDCGGGCGAECGVDCTRTCVGHNS